MAGRGPAPKDPAQRRRRNQDAPMKVVSADGSVHGPDLTEGIDWPDVTREWWQVWRTSPQASTFTETDWSFLLDTALLHMDFWDGNRSVAGELRLRVAKFGATPEDRARLKIEVGEPGKPEGKTPRPAARSRRERVLKAVEDAG